MNKKEISTIKSTIRYLLHCNGGKLKGHPQELLIQQLNDILIHHEGEDFLMFLADEDEPQSTIHYHIRFKHIPQWAYANDNEAAIAYTNVVESTIIEVKSDEKDVWQAFLNQLEIPETKWSEYQKVDIERAT